MRIGASQHRHQYHHEEVEDHGGVDTSDHLVSVSSGSESGVTRAARGLRRSFGFIPMARVAHRAHYAAGSE